MKNLTIKNRPLTPGFERGDIIAAWTYTHDDWKRYLRWQQQRRRKYAWMQILMVVTMSGTIGLLHISRLLGHQAMKKKTILITATGVVIRKRFIPFNTGNRELQSIHIIECLPAYILAIISHSIISQQKVTTILIPVPKGKLGEAVRLLMHFESRS